MPKTYASLPPSCSLSVPSFCCFHSPRRLPFPFLHSSFGQAPNQNSMNKLVGIGAAMSEQIWVEICCLSFASSSIWPGKSKQRKLKKEFYIFNHFLLPFPAFLCRFHFFNFQYYYYYYLPICSIYSISYFSYFSFFLLIH